MYIMLCLSRILININTTTYNNACTGTWCNRLYALTWSIREILLASFVLVFSSLFFWLRGSISHISRPRRSRSYRLANMSRETASQGKTSSGRGCQIDHSTLKTSGLASVKANYWKIAVRRGVKVPSPDVFAGLGARDPTGLGDRDPTAYEEVEISELDALSDCQ